MRGQVSKVWLAPVVAAMLLGCAGEVHIVPVRTGATMPLRAVRIVPADGLRQDRWEYLTENGLAAEMQSALAGSFPSGPGPELVVTVTEFAAPLHAGAAWLNVRFDVVDEHNRVLYSDVVETHADGDPTFWGGQSGARGHAARIVSRQVVERVAAAVSSAQPRNAGAASSAPPPAMASAPPPNSGPPPSAPPPSQAPPAQTSAAPAPTPAADLRPEVQPTATTPAPAQTTGDCRPPCRSGFLCHQGQCISACNPPCAAGQRCTAQGECEHRAPAGG